MEINLQPYENLIIKKLQKLKKFLQWVDNKQILRGGYNSFNVFNLNIVGQRNNKKRIEEISKHVSFENKNIIDFGCNTGGITFHLKNPNFVLGIDFDNKSIKACKYIHKLLIKQEPSLKDRYKFLRKDLNTDNLEFINNYISGSADIIFLCH